MDVIDIQDMIYIYMDILDMIQYDIYIYGIRIYTHVSDFVLGIYCSVCTKNPDKTSFLVCAVLCTMSAVPFISGLVHQHQSDCIPSSIRLVCLIYL